MSVVLALEIMPTQRPFPLRSFPVRTMPLQNPLPQTCRLSKRNLILILSRIRKRLRSRFPAYLGQIQ